MTKKTNASAKVDLKRRKMLALLGLTATAAYASPLLLGMGQASATTQPTRATRPTRPTRPN